MAEALYGLEGYYTSPRSIIGPRGDFTTTPKLTKLLARRIAEWIESAWKRQGRKLPVIELGPGDGTLAKDIRNSLGFFLRQKLDYHFVEISPHLAKQQQKKNKGTWHLAKKAIRQFGIWGMGICVQPHRPSHVHCEGHPMSFGGVTGAISRFLRFGHISPRKNDMRDI